MKRGLKLWHVTEDIDLLLAGWTAQKVEGDPKSAPLVLDKVLDALSVVQMSAPELDNRVGAELTREANATEIIFCALAVETGRAFQLASNSTTLMTALGVCFRAWRNLRRWTNWLYYRVQGDPDLGLWALEWDR